MKKKIHLLLAQVLIILIMMFNPSTAFAIGENWWIYQGIGYPGTEENYVPIGLDEINDYRMLSFVNTTYSTDGSGSVTLNNGYFYTYNKNGTISKAYALDSSAMDSVNLDQCTPADYESLASNITTYNYKNGKLSTVITKNKKKKTKSLSYSYKKGKLSQITLRDYNLNNKTVYIFSNGKLIEKDHYYKNKINSIRTFKYNKKGYVSQMMDYGANKSIKESKADITYEYKNGSIYKLTLINTYLDGEPTQAKATIIYYTKGPKKGFPISQSTCGKTSSTNWKWTKPTITKYSYDIDDSHKTVKSMYYYAYGTLYKKYDFTWAEK